MDSRELCLDTGALIAFLRGIEPMATAVELAVINRVCIVTAITAYELLYGAARAQRQIGEDALLSVMTVVPFDEAAARRAARLHSDLIHANADIGIKDTFIAAICLERSLPILTRNEQYLARVQGLMVLTAEQFMKQ